MVITSGNEITPISYKRNVLPVPFWHFTRFLDSRSQGLPRLLTIFSPMDSPNRANGFPSICQSRGSDLQAGQGSLAACTVKSLLCNNRSELVQFIFCCLSFKWLQQAVTEWELHVFHLREASLQPMTQHPKTPKTWVCIQFTTEGKPDKALSFHYDIEKLANFARIP